MIALCLSVWLTEWVTVRSQKGDAENLPGLSKPRHDGVKNFLKFVIKRILRCRNLNPFENNLWTWAASEYSAHKKSTPWYTSICDTKAGTSLGRWKKTSLYWAWAQQKWLPKRCPEYSTHKKVLHDTLLFVTLKPGHYLDGGKRHH